MNREKLIKELFEKLQSEYKTLARDESNLENLKKKNFLTKIDSRFNQIIENYLRKHDEKFQLQSEEDLSFDGNPENPDYTAIIDEIDGTHHLIEQEGPFGTVIGVAKSDNPCFKDIICAGYLDLNNDKLYYALKDEGAFIESNGETKQLETSKKTDFKQGSEIKVLIQQGFLADAPEIAKEAWKRWCNDYGSQAKHFALIASGRRDVYITGGHSKIEFKPSNTAEEAAGMYLIVEESGGSILNWNGKKISERKIGMDEGKNHDLVAAATEELARQVAKEAIPEKYS